MTTVDSNVLISSIAVASLGLAGFYWALATFLVAVRKRIVEKAEFPVHEKPLLLPPPLKKIPKQPVVAVKNISPMATPKVVAPASLDAVATPESIAAAEKAFGSTMQWEKYDVPTMQRVQPKPEKLLESLSKAIVVQPAAQPPKTKTKRTRKKQIQDTQVTDAAAA